MSWNRFAYVYNNPINNVDPSGHIPVVLGAAYTVVDTAWDAVDLYSDVRDCLGDSDSMACAMLPIDALAVVALFAEGPSNNVARRAAKAADAGDAAGDVGRRVEDTKKVWASDPVEWTATRPKGTQQTYEVYQRSDIDWDLVRTDGPSNFVGKTNAEAKLAGLPPQLEDGSFVTLHHLGQDSRGPIVEASTRYHGVGKYGQDALHSLYGRSKPHPLYPIDRKMFAIDQREYFKWRNW